MEKITVNATKKYDVVIGDGLLDRLGELIRSTGFNGKITIITDKTVDKLYSEKVVKNLIGSGFIVFKYVLDGGENSKTGAEFLNILEFLAKNEFTRSDAVIALGGGVVGDISGFVSACYLRGIKFFQVPTTLLAFVDSSVGGKTAINLKAGKNLAGAFYQPEMVVCDITTAKTLPKAEYACGMAEIIKYGMIFDAELLNLLEKGMEENSEKVVARCVDLKRIVVENDEFDNGERQLLNFGHTLGHAVEKESGYNIPHGKAVGIGMHLITESAVNSGVCDEEVLKILDFLLDKYEIPNNCDIPINTLLERTMVDKKRKGDMITVVTPYKLGGCRLEKISLTQWKEFIKD